MVYSVWFKGLKHTRILSVTLLKYVRNMIHFDIENNSKTTKTLIFTSISL